MAKKLSRMTRSHPDWKKFCKKLEGKKGCNFRKGPKGLTWTCTAGIERPIARKILKKMGNIDVDASLEYFAKHGGYCDCEILFNADR